MISFPLRSVPEVQKDEARLFPAHLLRLCPPPLSYAFGFLIPKGHGLESPLAPLFCADEFVCHQGEGSCCKGAICAKLCLSEGFADVVFCLHPVMEVCGRTMQ